ncbi:MULTISPECIES: M23 family metallopeptidase [unclassified Phenylobacterium]|uniref:M23 family metallopeptidase n=1 Tax=unclassified Phenylobacterium TaxID=2640670 RepID=UPI001B565C6A|nr:M23 family metallopeptidase [Phenylobacterium sp. NIBR 498073]MBP6876834.1 M23 family metallopeptidase [Phenylobacterium sp.]MBS0490352.1 M23 family metallopeptidase [Pseudomonadota bacterium]WGU38682.1 M23 family metallopeptidase [Phenylobacterium sp. NIBR 498073]
MRMTRFARLRRSLVELFPERHLYIRSGGEMRSFVLTTGRQMAIAGGVAAGALWMGVSTAAMMVNAMAVSSHDQQLARMQAKSERLVADREARLNSAMVQLNQAEGGIGALAASVENRHAALAMLLTEFKGQPGAQAALAPAIAKATSASTEVGPMRRIELVRAGQERLIDAADDFAKTRADRLRLAFRLAGLTPSTFVPKGGSLGGPLIEAKDPRALAAVLDVDEDFAERIQHAATNLSEAGALVDAAAKLPFARPTTAAAQTSSYGVRFDPFTRRPAFHSGLDFAGPTNTPIYSTAPGVVSFTGVRSGYGNTIEIDHGRGFKTRYAHLQAIGVRPGERVTVGSRIGGMGSTGRSTGPHLHYEVWVNGRAQNPSRFVKAGDYVLQGG